jgi:hypothetical protein
MSLRHQRRRRFRGQRRSLPQSQHHLLRRWAGHPVHYRGWRCLHRDQQNCCTRRQKQMRVERIVCDSQSSSFHNLSEGATVPASCSTLLTVFAGTVRLLFQHLYFFPQIGVCSGGEKVLSGLGECYPIKLRRAAQRFDKKYCPQFRDPRTLVDPNKAAATSSNNFCDDVSRLRFNGRLGARFVYRRLSLRRSIGVLEVSLNERDIREYRQRVAHALSHIDFARIIREAGTRSAKPVRIRR